MNVSHLFTKPTIHTNNVTRVTTFRICSVWGFLSIRKWSDIFHPCTVFCFVFLFGSTPSIIPHYVKTGSEELDIYLGLATSVYISIRTCVEVGHTSHTYQEMSRAIVVAVALLVNITSIGEHATRVRFLYSYIYVIGQRASL